MTISASSTHQTINYITAPATAAPVDYQALTTTARQERYRGQERVRLLFPKAIIPQLKAWVGQKYFIYAIEKLNPITQDIASAYVGKTNDVVKRLHKIGSVATLNPTFSAITNDLAQNIKSHPFVARVCLVCEAAEANDKEDEIIALYRAILGAANVHNIDDGGSGGVAQWVVAAQCDQPYVPTTYDTPTKKSGSFRKDENGQLVADLTPTKAQNVICILKRNDNDKRHVFKSADMQQEVWRYTHNANQSPQRKKRPLFADLERSPSKFALYKIKENIPPAHLSKHEKAAIVEKKAKGPVYNRDNGGTGPCPDPYRRPRKYAHAPV